MDRILVHRPGRIVTSCQRTGEICIFLHLDTLWMKYLITKKKVAGSANKMVKVKFNKRLFQCYRYLELRHAWQQCTNEALIEECNHKRVCNVLDQLITQWKAIKERKKRVAKMLQQERKFKRISVTKGSNINGD